MKKKRSYGGRKELATEAKKNDIVKIRLTQNQKLKIKTLHQISHSDNLSELIRTILFKKPVTVSLYIREISEIQTMVSNIKKAWNIYIKKGEDTDLKNLVEELKSNIGKIEATLTSLESCNIILDNLNEKNE